MATPRSLDGGTDHFPGHMLRAQGVSRDWMEQSRCRTASHDGTHQNFPWTVEPSDSGPLLLGRPAAGWIAMALSVCFACPAQYDCARFAVSVEEKWGTWSMKVEDLRALRRHPRRQEIIDAAEDASIPMQSIMQT